VIWLAVRDILRHGARRTTAVMGGTVTIVTLLALLVFGLFLGYDAIQRDRILRDPLHLCIWVGNHRARDAWVGADRLELLRRSLNDQLGGAEGLRGCYPLFHVSLEIHLLQKGSEQGSVPIEGRTIAPDDPLFDSRPLQVGNVFAPGHDEGLIISPQLLKELHRSPNSPMPDRLSVRVPSGRDVEVKVLGVTRDNLPLHFLFLMTESFRDKWLKEHRNVRAFNVHTGPIPKGWPPCDRLPKTVRKAIEDYDLLPPKPVGDPKEPAAWLLRSREATGTSIRSWSVYLRQIHELMAQAGYPRDKQFAVPKLLGAPVEEEDPSIDRMADSSTHHMAVVYVRRAELLKLARDVSQGLGIPAVDDEQTIEKLEKQSRQSRQGRDVLLAFVFLVGLIAAWNVGVIQEMRSHQKIEEIGMLKAIGMTQASCLRLYAVESVLIWTAGFLVGWALAAPLGARLGPWLLADPQAASEAVLAFDCGWLLTAVTAGVSLLFCVVVPTIIATLAAVRKSPIQTLGAN